MTATPLRVLVIDNFDGTDLGTIGVALDEVGAILDRRAAWRGEPLPDETGHDALIIMGGAQNALDDDRFPYLAHAAALTRRYTEAGKAVMGVCLGSQLVARGAGGRNVLGRPIEFGWHRVEPTEAGRADPVLAELGPGSPIFHWHFDTFDLPAGAVHLASSTMTPHQAFRLGRRTYGIQFHFEASTDVVERWSRDWNAQIEPHTPDWPQRHRLEAARHGSDADRTGLALARAFVGIASL